MVRLAVVLLLTATAASPLRALQQSVAERMRLGEVATASLDPAQALDHFEGVIAEDSSHFEALRRASYAAVLLGEALTDRKKQAAYYEKALTYARAAAGVKPGHPDSCYQLSLALGVAAVAVGGGEQVKFAREIREHALMVLEHKPQHSGAMHILGVWNAELMRLSGLKRLLARTFLDADFLAEASWASAISYAERAVELEPEQLRYHLDLARMYRDQKMRDKARESYRRVIEGTALQFNDSLYKSIAEAELAKIR